MGLLMITSATLWTKKLRKQKERGIIIYNFMKLLYIWEQNYDDVSMMGAITEDKLDDYIDHFIKERSKHWIVDSKVIAIDKTENSVDIFIKLDSTDRYLRPMARHPEANSAIGFNIEVIDTDQVNSFLRI
jgi:hypothetical protein